MAIDLKYTVLNAQHVPMQKQVEIDGETATATVTRTVIEAVPNDDMAADKTLTLVQPAGALEDFPEGSVFTVTITPAERVADAPVADPEA